eukprot:gene4760-5009_t
MSPAGRVQEVQDVEDDESDSSSDDLPPPLMPAEDDADRHNHNEAGSEEEESTEQEEAGPPPLEELSDDGHHDDKPAAAANGKNESKPPQSSMGESSLQQEQQELLPLLPPKGAVPNGSSRNPYRKKADSNGVGIAFTGSEEDDDDREDDDDDDEDYPPSLCNDDDPPPLCNDGEYANADKQQAHTDTAAKNWGKGINKGAGTGARRDLRPRGPATTDFTADSINAFMRSSAAAAPPAAGLGSTYPAGTSYGAQTQTQHAAPAQRPQQKQQWYENKKKKKEPAPAARDTPAETVTLKENLQAFAKEREELRKKMQMDRLDEERVDEKPVGRCCLNRGVGDVIHECKADKLAAKCWRIFQEEYERETRDAGLMGPHSHAGINLTQALRVRDKSKLPCVRCVTDNCPGYITFLGVFDGPLGHETFKSVQFTASPENLAAIKEAEAADAEQVLKQKQLRMEAAAAQRLETFRKKVGWKPAAPKKPRNKQPKQAAQHQQLKASSSKSGVIDDELIQTLSHTQQSGSRHHQESDPLQQLESGKLGDYRDPGYHSRLDELVAMHRDVGAQEAAGAGEKKKAAKKKGLRMGIDQFQAAALGDEAKVPEADYCALALQQLKVGLGDQIMTPYVLLECVDFYMLHKRGKDPEMELKALIKEKTGEEPILMWLFQRQEAAAVCMPSKDSAMLVNFFCHRYMFERKQLQACMLRDAPDPHTLHELMATPSGLVPVQSLQPVYGQVVRQPRQTQLHSPRSMNSSSTNMAIMLQQQQLACVCSMAAVVWTLLVLLVPPGSGDPGRIGTLESSGLLMYNNDTGRLEGLWRALSNSSSNQLITWQLVANYSLPRGVLGSLVQLTPVFKQRYPGPECQAVMQAIW